MNDLVGGKKFGKTIALEVRVAVNCCYMATFFKDFLHRGLTSASCVKLRGLETLKAFSETDREEAAAGGQIEKRETPRLKRRTGTPAEQVHKRKLKGSCRSSLPR